MNSEILTGQQSQYNTKSENRFIASENMVSHGGLNNLSFGDEDSNNKIVIGNALSINLCCIQYAVCYIGAKNNIQMHLAKMETN